MENNKNKKIRTRFAPSPTGFLHVGGLRTALYNYLFAKQKNGKFVLRIEDTDQKRQVKKGTEGILETLSKFLIWDEGLKVSQQGKIEQIGEYGPYMQSQRTEIYKKYANQLVAEGKAYYCFCSAERLEKMRQKKIENKQAPKYDGHCQKFSEKETKEKIKNGEKYVIRLKVDTQENIQFEDLIRGKVSFGAGNIDDQILVKSDGFPTYHLANVVDDYLMKITHVIRGDEWLSSTPKHILLYKAFNWKIPKFAHLPLLLNPDRSKLSKRQGDVAVEDYLKKGYLKETLLNFIALLGWNPGKGSEQEIFSLKELINEFNINKIHKGGAVFDLKKLDWMNSYYIKNKSNEELLILARPFFERYAKENKIKFDKNFFEKIIQVEKSRAEKLTDFTEEISFYFDQPNYDKKMLKWKDTENKEIIKNLEFMKVALKETDFKKLEYIQENLLRAADDKKGERLWPLRVALSGKEKSPSPFEIAWIIGKEESSKRVNRAIKKLKDE